jgi:HPt (histidine-containing phosphotransfer) domain-containing protein
MDISALLNPRVTDRESLTEFSEALTDQLPGIERCISDLRLNPTDRDLIAQLFRGLHTIKGDAGMCKLPVGVMIAHPMESVLARLREGEFQFSELLAELLLLALDRLELVIEALESGRAVDGLKLPELVGGMEYLAQVPPDRIDPQAARIIEAVTGFRPSSAARIATAALQTGSHDAQRDLAFFRRLAEALDQRSPLYQGRIDRLVRLALDTNTVAGNPIDPAQLEAAVYMHDVGMMFLPESIWLKVGKLTPDELTQMRGHVEHSADLLARMPGWEAAAQMVRQHHEMPTGEGYPAGAQGKDICAGAKIIAIIDAFESVTLKQSHRGQSRSLVRAIAEVNASDRQFDPVWIAHFNTVIRQSLES